MNEAQTRLEKIDPALKMAGWGVETESRIFPEVIINQSKISAQQKQTITRADYILSYKGTKLAVVEAKSDELPVSEGVQQAKNYADKLQLKFAFSTNGNQIYQIDLNTGEEKIINQFPSPKELWQKTMGDEDEWRDKFNLQPFYTNGSRQPRYYQEIAVNKVLAAVAAEQKRILLTLATGTGKTFIAFQIAYKLFESRWNLHKNNLRPRILFLADRNILADQAFNNFGGFNEDALVRIKPKEITKNGKMPTNGAVFFTIFQTFLTEKEELINYQEYPADFFDFIIIDECHRGGAKDESSWREILEYFSPAYQLGLTATPRRDVNADTYNYFGRPVYEYSLKQGINDGFLTPFRHRTMKSNIDDYIYSPEDEVLSGEVEIGKTYTESDFYQGRIEIRQRDETRVKEFMNLIEQNEKTLVFCSTQNHAAQIRDMINQFKKSNHPNYCVRVTANDGIIGEQYLAEFQDNEKIIPTVLTTSQKLSTGVDALNVRNIVLLRPVNSMVEFKQIVGRGTRIYEGKFYFTIYDFVEAYKNFADPAWDGEPVCSKCGNDPCTCNKNQSADKPILKKNDTGETIVDSNLETKLKIRLGDGRVRKIQYVKNDLFWDSSGRPISTEDFLNKIFGQLPEFFHSEEELNKIWSYPQTRENLLITMKEAGYDENILANVQDLVDAKDSDLIDVIKYIAYNKQPIKRLDRVEKAKHKIDFTYSDEQKEFINFVFRQYIQSGVGELTEDKLPILIEMYYDSPFTGVMKLNGVDEAKRIFVECQKLLYEE